MRFLPALLLIAAPLLAQEPSEEQRRAAADAKEAVARKYAQRSEELRRHIQDLRSKSEAAREEAMEAIKRANASLDELLPLIAQALEQVEGARGTIGALLAPGVRTLQLGSVASEVISGSADGTDYTLKSLGDGKYEFSATRYDDETKTKLMEKWLDKGTIKELQEKYAFLKAGLAIQVPDQQRRVVLRSAPMGNSAVAFLPLKYQGAWDATPWGGGGRVGVSVVAPSEELRFHLQLPEGAGFIVREVVRGSRAEQIGIRRMDILLKLDDELIDSPIQLKKLNDRTGVLEIIRRSETKKIDLATMPEPVEIPEVAEEAPPTRPAGAR